METFPGVLFYILIANVSEKVVSLSNHMVVTSANNALPRIIHASDQEPYKLYKPKPDNKTLPDGEWVEVNNVRP